MSFLQKAIERSKQREQEKQRKETTVPQNSDERKEAPKREIQPRKPPSRPRTTPKSTPVSHISMGTENLEIRLKVSDYAVVQSLMVDGRRRLETKEFHYNERQMLWGMAIALSTHLGRALSDQELVGTSWLDSRMIRWAVEYGYLQTQEDREGANQAQELLSHVTGQTKRVRPELKQPVSLATLQEQIIAAGKEKDLADFEAKMGALESWILQVVIPNLQAKAGLEAFE